MVQAADFPLIRREAIRRPQYVMDLTQTRDQNNGWPMNLILSNKSSLEVLKIDGMADYFFSLGLLNGTCKNGEDALNPI